MKRDLKSKNLLLGADGRLRLCDFGFARMSDFKTQRAMTICGTPGFVAPEIMMGNDYDSTCDTFSYGNVLAELITFQRPGKDFWTRSADDGYQLNLDELRKNSPKDTPKNFLELSLKCCAYDPVERPDFGYIVQLMKQIESEVPKDSFYLLL
jgi:LIM domain kinase 1